MKAAKEGRVENNLPSGFDAMHNLTRVISR